MVIFINVHDYLKRISILWCRGMREISISLGLLIASFKSSISLLCTWFLRELFYNLLLWVSFSQFLLIVLWIFCFVYFEAILSDVHMFMIFTCSCEFFLLSFYEDSFYLKTFFAVKSILFNVCQLSLGTCLFNLFFIFFTFILSMSIYIYI